MVFCIPRDLNQSTQSLADFQEFVMRYSASNSGGRVRRYESILFVDSQSSDPFLNSVTPTSPISDVVEADFQDALRDCRSSDSSFTWWWKPTDPQLSFVIDHPDFERDEDLYFMGLMSSNALVNSFVEDTEIEPVDSIDGIDQVFRAAARGFEDVNVDVSQLSRSFVRLIRDGSVEAFGAKARGVFVGSLLLHLSSENPDRAGIYWVAVEPEYRRRGIGSLLTSTAVNRARELGRKITVLQSSPMARGMYQRIGFLGELSMQSWIMKSSAMNTEPGQGTSNKEK